MIIFEAKGKSPRLILTASALDYMRRHRQTKCWHREAGGQMFSRLDGGGNVVDVVTGPRPSDRRTRRGYVPNRRAEREEIDRFYKDGLHLIGDWHTHPQKVPIPSSTDLDTVGDCVRKSGWTAYGLFLVVVGTELSPAGLHVTFHDGTQAATLMAVMTGRHDEQMMKELRP